MGSRGRAEAEGVWESAGDVVLFLTLLFLSPKEPSTEILEHGQNISKRVPSSPRDSGENPLPAAPYLGAGSGMRNAPPGCPPGWEPGETSRWVLVPGGSGLPFLSTCPLLPHDSLLSQPGDKYWEVDGNTQQTL